MLKNFLISFYRNICKHRLYAAINIIGLSIGIAACILITLFVTDEISYDKFHENGDHLFRVVQLNYDMKTGKESNRNPFLPPAMGPEFLHLFDEVKYMTRQMWSECVVQYGEKQFQENVQMVDSPFFQMFSFPLLSGDPAAVLTEDNTVVFTESHAEKYFGSENPIGKIVTIRFGQTSKDFFVSGIAQNPPARSSLQFDMLIHIENLTLGDNNPGVLLDWERWYFPFYVQLHENRSAEQLERDLPQFCSQFFSEAFKKQSFSFALQPFRDIYLDTGASGGRGLTTSYILMSIAFIILLVGCVNFMNISVGLSSARSMEVGIRKVVGADRNHLMRQFWGEAILLSFIAMVGGLILAGVVLPKFNELADKQLSLTGFLSSAFAPAIFIIPLAAGILAGCYPAFVMSAFRPIDILKKKLKIGGGSYLTKGLVILQFGLSVALIVIAVVLGRQADMMIHMDLGYNKEKLVVVTAQENDQIGSEGLYRRFRNRIIHQSGIEGVTACNREFGLFLPGSSLDFSGDKVAYRFNRVDPYFVSTLGLELIQGRDFSESVSADENAVLVNQRFVESLGPEFEMGMALGNPSRGFPYRCRIVGVLKDFHFRSVRQELEPLILFVGSHENPRRNVYSRIFIRFRGEKISETMAFLEKTWKDVQPEKPFTAFFQDQVLERQYQREKRWSRIIRYASMLSIILACLGIFGQAAIGLSRRVKEIGIRKILGAKTEQIIRLVAMEYLGLVFIANLAAWPVAYFLLHRVLQNYPYRMGLNIFYFLFTGLGTIALSVLTIFYLSIRAARADPVNALRYE